MAETDEIINSILYGKQGSKELPYAPPAPKISMAPWESKIKHSNPLSMKLQPLGAETVSGPNKIEREDSGVSKRPYIPKTDLKWDEPLGAGYKSPLHPPVGLQPIKALYGGNSFYGDVPKITLSSLAGINKLGGGNPNLFSGANMPKIGVPQAGSGWNI